MADEGAGNARALWKMDIQAVPYPDLGERIKKALGDDARVKRSRSEADTYLRRKGIISVETSRAFLERSFILLDVWQDLMDEAQTDTTAIYACLTTVMHVAESTACLPISILNDRGYLAFCQGDFVALPVGVLMSYISGKPPFLSDPSWPHDGVMTLAHCTAPRKMDGEHYESAKILTHFESNYGAAPKVLMSKGQPITNVVADFAGRRHLGVNAEISDVPSLPICRSQIDIRIKGDWERLLTETGGWHWMTVYGDYFKELKYALNKMGIDFPIIT